MSRYNKLLQIINERFDALARKLDERRPANLLQSPEYERGYTQASKNAAGRIDDWVNYGYTTGVKMERERIVKFVDEYIRLWQKCPGPHPEAWDFEELRKKIEAGADDREKKP